MRFNALLLPATLIATVAAASSGKEILSGWDTNSLKEFLSDFQVPFTDKDTPQDLADKASAEWDIYTKPYSQWSLNDLKFYAKKKVASGFDTVAEGRDKFHYDIKDSKDEIVANIDKYWTDASDTYDDISSWAYRYWSKSELAKLVGKVKPGQSNTEKVLTSLSHSDLVKEAQELSDKTANAISGTSKKGYYPRTDFFKNLSTDDLKELLNSHSISFPDDADRKALVATLRKNLRSIYYEGQDKLVDVLTKLKVDSRDIYDKSGEIKRDVFKQWSQADLESWLNNHELLPSTKDAKRTKDDLVKIAEDNVQTLKDDIDTYIAYKKTQVSPFLSKASDAVKNSYDTISDATHNLWPEAGYSHLQQVLNTQSDRGKQLLQYLKDKATPAPKKTSIADTIFPTKHTDYFSGWSTPDLKEWLTEQGQVAAGTKDELVESASAYLNSLVDSARSKADATAANAQAAHKGACGYYKYFTDQIQIASNSANIWWLKLKNFLLSFRV
ncbi:hypothetical protein D0Z00_000058 [Geotrichum galactomycetum]|uniref:Uncharacterized protein n=1 Tax=Geotrichum galactomycetum TaxID=27317 RepID=A0ACB6VAY8_9ASCO|nr:hypothetical protein D0Z00_000058 [Geotrichum candidum]